MRIIYTALALFVLVVSVSCVKESNTGPVSRAKLSGLAEKGPFVKGSKVSIRELTDELVPTGKVFTTEIIDDLGRYETGNLELVSPYAEIVVEGNYFNEVTGEVSTVPITLGAIADLSRQNTANVNLLTHLEQGRVRHLVSGGASFAQAKKQAANEVIKAFYIDREVNEFADRMSLMDPNEHASILYTLSIYVLNGVADETALSAKLQQLASDIELNGEFSDQNDEFVLQSMQSLEYQHTLGNLIARYLVLGVDIDVNEIVKSAPETPPSGTTESFFDNPNHYWQLFNTGMSTFINYYQALTLFEASFTGVADAQENPRYAPIASRQVDVNNSQLADMWLVGVLAVQRFNMIIDRSRTSAFPDTHIMEHYGHTHRALIYWSMMSLWGDLPYFDAPIVNTRDNFVSRSPSAEIIDKLIPSLKTAADQIPLQPNEYGFGKTFPFAMLARLSLMKGDYEATRQYAENIIQTGQYSLSANEYDATERVYGYEWDYYYPSTRYTADYQSLINESQTIHYIGYPEILLMASEACLKLGESTKALAYLNEVRENNGKAPINASQTATILESIMEEIRDELGKDALWLLALKRNGLAESTLGLPAHRTVLPIPGEAIQSNPRLTQNPGY